MGTILPSIGAQMGPGWGAFVKRIPYGEDSTFGQVVADQVRFRITRSGATSVKDVRPDSVAARQLWKEPTTKQFAQGVLDLANDVNTTASPIRGFTLSSDAAGYVANRALHAFRTDTPTMEAFEAGIEAATRHTDKTAAVRKGSWLHLGPDRSSGFITVLNAPDAAQSADTSAALGRGVKTLLHELNHIGSPRPSNASHLNWLSEGAAESLARWPGHVERAGERLKIDVPAGVGAAFDDARHPYQGEVDSVRSLLRMAGIDPARADHFQTAQRMLNESSELELPKVFGEAIARHHGDPALADEIARIMTRGIEVGGRRADPTPLLQLEASLSSRSFRA